MNDSLLRIQPISQKSQESPGSDIDNAEQKPLQRGQVERTEDHKHIEDDNRCSDGSFLLNERVLHGKSVAMEISFVEHLDKGLDKEGVSDD